MLLTVSLVQHLEVCDQDSYHLQTNLQVVEHKQWLHSGFLF